LSPSITLLSFSFFFSLAVNRGHPTLLPACLFQRTKLEIVLSGFLKERERNEPREALEKERKALKS